jgi:hypothetical protein
MMSAGLPARPPKAPAVLAHMTISKVESFFPPLAISVLSLSYAPKRTIEYVSWRKIDADNPVYSPRTPGKSAGRSQQKVCCSSPAVCRTSFIDRPKVVLVAAVCIRLMISIAQRRMALRLTLSSHLGDACSMLPLLVSAAPLQVNSSKLTRCSCTSCPEPVSA